MGRKTRKFIDKRTDEVYSFRVVPRSQQDPLVADESAPQAVLVDTQDNKETEKTYGVYFDDDYDYLKHLRSTSEGINWNDEHLEVYEIRAQDPQASKKEIRNKRLKLPSSVFESYIEEPIGLLNRAAPISGPCPELDPDVVAHLDDACAHEKDISGVDNILEMLGGDDEWTEGEEDEEIWGINKMGNGQDYDAIEDAEADNMDSYMSMDEEMPPLEQFRDDEGIPEVLIKKGKESDTESVESGDEWSIRGVEQDYSSDFNVSDDEGDEARDTMGHMMEHCDFEETKSHFTEYSMTSSVVRRSEGLRDLDDQFQAMFIREYGEEQIGALDGEDIEGFVSETSDLYTQALTQTKKQFEVISNLEDEKSWIVRWIQDQEKKMARGEIDAQPEEEIEIMEKDPDNKWDCESILSTYSNLYNHPKTLDRPGKRIAIDPNTGLPMEYSSRKGLTKKALAMHDGVEEEDSDDDLDTRTLMSKISAISVRPPGETPEERIARKKATKELNREKRILKKLNKLAFKEEKKKQEKINMNNARCRTVKVV